MKSFCIKTNNNAILEYLLDKLDYLELEEVKYSKNKFKIYSNIIVHYIGEKISFRRFTRLTKNDNQVFGSYSHMGGRIAALVLLNGTDQEAAYEIAMHAAAMNPQYVKSSEVPTEVLEKEKSIMREELLKEGKPADRIENILVGKVNKYYSEICLEDQIFIKAENKETVKAYAEAHGCEIVNMVRYEVGEGIEKKQENFAEEVMNQING